MFEDTGSRLSFYPLKSTLAGLAFICLAFVCVTVGQTDPSVCPADRINNLLGATTTQSLLIFTDGRTDANWQGATKGFAGNVIVDGIQASERTSGSVPFAGVIITNDTTLGAWQAIINQNVGQATAGTGNTAVVNQAQSDVGNAIVSILALPVTPGFAGVSSTSLNNLDTTNGVAETIVIDVTTNFNVTNKIKIKGDKGDLFILRWDSDENFSNGLNGQVQFQSGGAIIPDGDLTPGNFINVAGNIGSSGGGQNPAPPYPQGPRLDNGTGVLINGGSDFSGGGFFTGYWLTTGTPTITDPATGLLVGPTSSLSNGIFVGGWYTLTTQFSMTSGTSGVNVVCNPLDVTAAPADISGRVVDSGGRAIGRATLSLINPSTGVVEHALTSPFGYYRFSNVETGEVYLLVVSGKGYVFPDSPRTISLLDNLTDLDFVGTPVELSVPAKAQSRTLRPEK